MATNCTHLCAAKGCTVPMKSTVLMCRDHWLMVPAPLRAVVSDSWRKYVLGKSKLSWRLYYANRLAAISAVEQAKVTA